MSNKKRRSSKHQIRKPAKYDDTVCDLGKSKGAKSVNNSVKASSECGHEESGDIGMDNGQMDMESVKRNDGAIRNENLECNEECGIKDKEPMCQNIKG